MPTYQLNINQQTLAIEAEPEMPLLWVLRDLLGLTGTKYSCGMGLCGACTILVDGQAVRACQTPVATLGEQTIITIEGLSTDGSHPVQQAWQAENVAQCGYCQPGQIMAAVALLTATPNPNDAEIDEALHGVLCRCGTYQRIRAAIYSAALGVTS